jgi:DNA polymerase V
MKNLPPSRGGSRPGAGRKPGSGTYGEPTQTIRLPVSSVGVVKDFLSAYQARHRLEQSLATAEVYSPQPEAPPRALPLFGHKVPAGFPSPADDYLEATLDLNEYLVPHQEASFFVRVKGHSMTGAGIFDGDLLVVDRSIEPAPGKIIIAVVDGELTVKRLAIEDGRPVLKAQNPHFKDIVLRDAQELLCWGVVTSTIRKLD